MQVNLILLDRNYNIPNTLFQSDVFMAQMSNNTRELIEKRQQGRVLTAIRGKLRQYAKAGETDQSELGRWNAIDIITEVKKVRVITGYRCVLLKQTTNTIFL